MKSWTAGAAVGALLLLAVVPMALVRLVDADEGAYLLAARLVMEGKSLYHDFFYPQMPLLPYVYGVWSLLVGPSWYGARLLSALFTVALGLVLFQHLARLTASLGWAAAGVLLYGASALTLAWMPLVKTYALTGLLVFAAGALLSFRPGPGRQLAGGGLLGLAVAIRLYPIALVPVLAAVVLAETRGRGQLAAVGRFLGGLALGLLPAAPLALRDPDTFAFNVIGYQAIRSDGFGLIGAAGQKLETAARLVGLDGVEAAAGVQVLLLLLLNAALLGLVAARVVSATMSLPVAAVLLVVSLLPTPTYTQYFCLAVPFLVVNAVLALRWADGRLAALGAEARRLARLGALVAGVVYVAMAPLEAHRYAWDGRDVPGIFRTDNAVNWRIDTVTRVTRALDERGGGHGMAITWWPGYLVGSRAALLPGMENHWNWRYADALSDAELRKYHYISHDGIARSILRRRGDVVVLGNWVFGAAPAYRVILARGGYTLVGRVGDAEIYVPPARPVR
jgi:hypothetical protein